MFFFDRFKESRTRETPFNETSAHVRFSKVSTEPNSEWFWITSLVLMNGRLVVPIVSILLTFLAPTSVQSQENATQIEMTRPSTVELPKPPNFGQSEWTTPGFLVAADPKLIEQAIRLRHSMSVEQQQEVKPPQARPRDVTGQWDGFYSIRRSLVAVSLNLEPVNTKEWKGTAKFFKPMTGKNKGLSKDPIRVGTAAVTVQKNNVMKIEVSFWKQRGSKGKYVDELLTFDGVLANSPDRIGGEVTRTNPTRNARKYDIGHGFVLAHEATDRKRLMDSIVDAAAAAYEFRYKVLPKQKWPVLNDPRLTESILQWSEMFTKEYRNVDIRNTQTQKLFPLAANLFADEHFEKHFGEKFDEMSDVRSYAIGREMANGARGKLGADNIEAFRNITAFASLFDTGGTSDRIETFSHLWPRREIHRWMRQRATDEESKNQSAPFKFSLAAAKQFANRVERRVARKTNGIELEKRLVENKRLESSLKKLGPGLFDAYVARLVRQDPSSTKLDQLLMWKRGLRANVGLSIEDQEHSLRLQNVIDRRLSWIIQQRLEPVVNELAALRDSYASIIQTDRIYKSLEKTYGRRGRGLLGNSKTRQEKWKKAPSVEQTFDYLIRLRSAMIERNFLAVTAEMGSIKDKRSLSKYTNDLLYLPLAKGSSVTQMVRSARMSREGEIDRALRMSHFSTLEVSLMDSKDEIQIPKLIEPPTEQEIKLAMVRAYAASVPSGRQTAPDTYEYVVSLLNIPVKKTQIKIVAVEQIEKAIKLENGGFRVKFRHSSRTRFMFLERDQFVTEMQNELVKQADGIFMKPVEETFVLTESGWQSPSMIKEIAASELVIKGKAARAMGMKFDPKFKRFIDSKFPEPVPLRK